MLLTSRASKLAGLICNIFRNLFQVSHNLHDLRVKEYLVRKFLRENCLERVRSLLGSLTRRDCKVVVTNYIQGKTLLYLAVKSRNRNLVSFLVECGANVNERLLTEDNSPVLMTAIKSGDFGMVLTLDKLRVNLEKKDKKDCNAIVYALLNRQLKLAHYLKLRNVDINSSMSVLNCSKDLYYLEQALKLNFDVNFLGTCNNNAFIFAACWGRVDILKSLLAHGADIYHRNSRGSNALCQALFHRQYQVIQFFMSELYSIHDYIETLEFNGATDMIFANEFVFSFECWVLALEIRNLSGFARQKNSEYVDNIGEEYVSLEELNSMGNDCLKLLLQALLTFLRVLSPKHPHLHDAFATVASKNYLLDDYETTFKILTQLFLFHSNEANVIKDAGYKALKSGLIVLERTVNLDVSANVEDAYYIRFELMFSFVTTNVWSLLCIDEKTNITFYNCYRKYLIIILDLMSLMYCEGIIAEQEPLLYLLLGVLVKKQLPFYPIALLHVAVEKNYGLYIVRMLVNCGASVDCKDIDGNTPLDFAFAYSDKNKNKNKIIQLLISAGGDINAVKSPRYRSPRMRNRRTQRTKEAKIIVRFEQVGKSEPKNISLICETLYRAQNCSRLS